MRRNDVKKSGLQGVIAMTTQTQAEQTQVFGLAQIADEFQISFEKATFLSLVTLGWSNEKAYLALRPDVSVTSARSAGGRWVGQSRPILKRLRKADALPALADYRTFQLLEGDDKQRWMDAIREVNRVSGRYDRSGNAASDAGSLTAMLAALAKPVPRAEESSLAELEEIVDLRRPGG
jgi:hypothetical protein